MSSSSHTPITILGAGPGGLWTAATLARSGVRSLVLERDGFPRDKICGDALSGKVVEVMRKVEPAWVEELAGEATMLGSWGVTFVAPNQKALRVPFRKDFNKSDTAPGFIGKRVDFDHWLMKKATSLPEVELRENTEAWRFERSEIGWKIFDRKDQLITETSLIIAADGAHSRFAKTHGGIRMEPAHYCAGLRAYYTGVKGMDKDNFIELHFLKDFLPGYFWIFPLPNGMANVGVGMRSDKMQGKKVNLKARMLELIETDPALKERFSEAKLVDKVSGFGLPLGSKKRPLSGNRFMLIGDAGALIDPFTGEGIGNAMYSGWFAAQQALTCLQTEDFSAKAIAPYDTAVYDRLWSELKLSKRMQELVRFPWLFNLVVNKANRNAALSEMISCMFEDLDIRERLKSPAFYLKLLFSG